jgi:hypothetical protein
MPRVRVRAITVSFLLAGCFGAYQMRPDDWSWWIVFR